MSESSYNLALIADSCGQSESVTLKMKMNTLLFSTCKTTPGVVVVYPCLLLHEEQQAKTSLVRAQMWERREKSKDPKALLAGALAELTSSDEAALCGQSVPVTLKAYTLEKLAESDT
jgi:hypothetical protein